MDILDAFEFDAPVSVSAEIIAATSQEPLNLRPLCEEAIARVFSKHIVFVRSDDGSPIVEVVVSELIELTEDDNQQTITFRLLQPKNTVAVVQVYCDDSANRAALYQTVKAKRTALERIS